MKSFRQIVSEVAQPSAEDELNFKEKHVIDHILDPNAEEEQFTADEIKKFFNRADYKKGEDMAVYEGVTLARRDLPGQEDSDVDNDGDRDSADAQLRYRRHAQIKNKIIDESWSKGSSTSYHSDAIAAAKYRKKAAEAHRTARRLGKDHPDYSKHMAAWHSAEAKNVKHSYHAGEWGSMADAKEDYKDHMDQAKKWRSGEMKESVEELIEISLEKKKDYYSKAIASKRGWGFGWKGKEGETTRKDLDRADKRGRAMSKAQDDIRNAENPVRAKVHDFSNMTDGDIYDLTQTSDKVKDGDVMKLSKGRAGVLMQAWPVITHGKSKIFHTVAKGKHISTIDKGRYKKSFEVASNHATAKEHINEEVSSSQATNTYEAKMSDAQMKKREEIVMSMKDNAADLKKRYGADWKSVMYAIATKQAMAEAKLDPVGREDDDVDNDGKVTKSDAYLKARRRAIAKKLQQEGLMDVVQPNGGEYGDEERTHVAYKKSNVKQPELHGEPLKTESINEASKETLGRYIKAAGPDRERLMKRATQTSRLGHDFKAAGDSKKAQELFGRAGEDALKAANRKAGINKAVDKLTKKEDVSLVKPKAGLRIYAGKTKESDIKESLREGIIDLVDGTSIEINEADASVLHAMYESLDQKNRVMMEEIMSSSFEGLDYVLKFAKEVM